MRKTILFLFAILSLAVNTSWAAATDTVGFQIFPFKWTCVDTVHIQNLSSGGTSYEWNFGDTVIVTNDTLPVSHVYEYSGSYLITLVARRNGVILGMAYDSVTVNGRYAGQIYDSVDCRHPYVAANDSVYSYPCDTVFWVREGGCRHAYKLHLGHITTHYNMTRMLCGGESLCVCDTCISTRGQYHLSVVSPDGCDSIVDLTVYTGGNVRDTIVHDYCRGDQAVISYRTFTESATFIDTLTAFCGGDSIVVHIINFHDATREVIVRKICFGDSVEYEGKYYSVPNNYVHRYSSIYGCDSVVTLQVELYDSYYKVDSVVVTDNVYLWEGRTITKSGRYYAPYKTKEGCDSILELYIIFDRPERTYLYNRICSGEIVNFNGKRLTQTGIYVDTLHTVLSGQDSIVTLNLQVLTTIYDTIRMKTCGTSYTFHGQTYTEGGSYDLVFPYTKQSPTDTLNCDSVVYHLELELCPSYRHEDAFIFSCSAMSYFWPVDSFTYTLPAKTVTHHYTTDCGCDSDYVLTLALPMSYRIHKKCAGTSVIINGDTITEPGQYTFNLKSSCGLDSLEVIEVVDEPITERFDTAYICIGGSYHYNENIYSVSGDYTDTFPKYDPCPEYHHLHLVVCDTFHVVERMELCIDTTLIWHGKSINSSGHYFARFKSSHGCDSVYEGFITINRPKITKLNAQICQGDSCQVGRYWHKKTGIYYDTLLTTSGCDSIIQLTLNVMPKYFYPLKDTFCQGGQYNFRGQILTHPGVYYDSLKTVAGCDSIYRLDLVMLRPSHIIEYVTECKRTTYPWHGMYLTKSGTYYDTLTNASGCDSIIELRLSLYKPAFTSTFATICKGDSLMFGDRYVSHAGRFYDTLRTTHGCDSIVELCLNIQPRILSQINAVICFGDTYKFNGVQLTDAGIYFDTLTTIHGCDSIIRLVLQVTPPDNVTEQHVFICDGDSFSFRGHVFYDEGIFYDTLMSIHGCDSVVKYVFTVSSTMHDYKSASICQGDYYNFHGRKLVSAGSFTHVERDPVSNCETAVYHLDLEVRPSYYSYEQDTICDDQIYVWHGQRITESGVYTDSSSAVNGCDSIFELQIVVNHKQYVERNIQLCSGQSVRVNGRLFSQPGIYCDSTLTSRGCDSITKFIVTVPPDYFISDTVFVCRGAYYNFKGRNVQSPGTYRDTFVTTSGCDSIFEIVVNPVVGVRNIEHDTVCSDVPYVWHGRLFTQSGIYCDTIVSSEGCISIDELWLVYNRSYKQTRTVVLCPGQTYLYKGIDYSTPGTYVDTLVTRSGCDSIVTLVVIRDYDHEIFDTVTICQGDYVDFHNRRIFNSGDYIHVESTPNGCDSICHLHVEVRPTFHKMENVTICSNDLYPWRGRNLSASGIYYDSVPTPLGCDSVFELHLVKYAINTVTTNAVICEGEQFFYRGINYSKQGVYYDTVTSAHGCDSILKIVVDIAPSYLYVDTARLCPGSSLAFRGKTITTAGTFYDSLRSINGCDSVYKLVVLPVILTPHIESDTVCSDVPYFWHGMALTNSGVYLDTFQTDDGCVDVYELRLEYRRSYNITNSVMLCPGQTYTYNNIDRSTPGVYVDSLTTLLGCDSVVTTIVTENFNYDFYDTVAICRSDYYVFFGQRLVNAGDYYHVINASYTGCDTIYHVHLVIKPDNHSLVSDTICSNGYVNWRGHYLSASGVYFDTVATLDGCDSIFEFRLTLFPVSDTIISESICEGDTYYLHNRPYKYQGTYYDTLQNRFGCDSIVELVLNVRSKFTFVHDDTICQGETYRFFGTDVRNAGTYRRTVPAPNGCDSVFILNLTVNPINLTTIDTTICLGNVFFHRGQRITQSVTIFDTVMVGGCYDVTEIHVNVKSPIYHYDTLYVIKGDTLVYRNKPYTRKGVYYETLKSVEGCDSMIYVLQLEYVPYQKYLNINICDNEPVWVYDHYYDHSVSDTVFYTSGSNDVADTLFYVNVIAFPHAETVIYDTVCNNGAYRFVHGQMLTRSGIYIDTLTTSTGCDSIITLHLEILDRDENYSNDTICVNDVYHWVGPNRVITMAGHYYDSVQNPLCKCYKYYELDLTVIQETKLQTVNGSVNSVTVCADEDRYTIWPTFTGPTPTEYIVAYDGVKIEENNNDTGLYDGISIVLPLPRDKNNAKIRPDVYPVTLYVGNGYCDHTQYSLNFDLHVNYDSATIRQHFGNVVSVRNSNYNGGYTFSGYMWFVNGSMVIDANESNLYMPSLVPGDVVYAMLRRQNEIDFIPTCPITIQPYSDIHPYPTLDGTLLLPGSMARLNSPEAGTYSLYDMSGMLISTGKFMDGDTDISMPYVSGCYLLNVSTDSYTYTFKVIVR